MQRSAIFSVAVHNPEKTGPAEAGNFSFRLREGAKVVAFANTFLWDHDRNLYAALKDFLGWYKPNVILILGRFIHDESFQRMAHRQFREKDRHPVAPEVQAAHDSSDIWEERILALGRTAGKELEALRDAAGPQCHIIYIPAAQGQTPPEAEIKTIIETTLKRITAWRKGDKKLADREFPTLPVLPDEFDVLLGLPGAGMTDHTHPNIFVLPFGAAATMICEVVVDGTVSDGAKVRFEIGNNRLKNPGSASYRAVWDNLVSTVRGYDGKISTAWWTKLQESIIGRRLHLFCSEVGNLMASERLGRIDTGQQYWSKGFFTGVVVRGSLHGQSFPFKRKDESRRAAVIFGKVVEEKEPGGFGRTGEIHIADH
jgi:hypothetical protein